MASGTSSTGDRPPRAAAWEQATAVSERLRVVIIETKARLRNVGIISLHEGERGAPSASSQ